jgi:hypothetical protein
VKDQYAADLAVCPDPSRRDRIELDLPSTDDVDRLATLVATAMAENL